MSTEPALSCEQISLIYRDGERTTHALRELSLSLPPGRFYGIMGPSGSGKSSLLYLLSGLKRPSTGKVCCGRDILSALPDTAVTRLRRERFGFVFQQPFLLSYLTALENILLGAHRQDRATIDRAKTLLDQLGLGGMGEKYPGQLSGGERQRVAVVRAMINDPQIIFADEPTASLDQTNGFKVIEALAAWRPKGTIVVVTHDAAMVRDADQVLRLQDGRLAD